MRKIEITCVRKHDAPGAAGDDAPRQWAVEMKELAAGGAAAFGMPLTILTTDRAEFTPGDVFELVKVQG